MTKKLSVLLLIVLLLLTACTAERNADYPVAEEGETEYMPGDLADCYLAILDQLYDDGGDQKAQPKLVFFNTSGMRSLNILGKLKLLREIAGRGAIALVMNDDFDERKSKGIIMNLLIKKANGFISSWPMCRCQMAQ